MQLVVVAQADPPGTTCPEQRLDRHTGRLERQQQPDAVHVARVEPPILVGLDRAGIGQLRHALPADAEPQREVIGREARWSARRRAGWIA